MKKIYDYIIYSLLALIVIVSVILFLPKKDSISEYTLEVKTKNIEINQSDNYCY